MTVHHIIKNVAMVSLLGSLLLSGCSEAETSGTEKALNRPALSISPSEIDLGTVKIGTDNQFTARVVNLQSSPISIDRVTSSCGCTDVNIDKMQLAPGESAALSGVLRAGHSPSTLSKEIRIELSGGEVVAALLTAQVVRDLRWSPQELVLQPDILSEGSGTGEFSFENDSDAPIRLENPEHAAWEHITVQLPTQQIPPGGSAKVTVRASADCITDQRAIILLETSHPRENRLELPVRIQPKHSVNPTPDRIHLGIASQAQLLERAPLSVTIRGPLLPSLVCSGVKAPSYLRLDEEFSDSIDARTFQFAFIDSLPDIDLSGQIVFSFQHRDSERRFSTSVPISGFLMDQSQGQSASGAK